MRQLTIDAVVQRTSRFIAFTFTVLASATMCPATHAVTQYSITDLGVPEGVDFSEGIDINDHGQVAARTWAHGYFFGFIWEEGTRTVLETGFQYNCPAGINNHGSVVGDTSSSAKIEHGFLWEDGHFVLLGHVPGGQDWTYPSAVNDAGLVVGYSLGDPDNSRQFFTWEDGTFTNHGIVPVEYDPEPPVIVIAGSSAQDVNELGQVVGNTNGREYFSDRPFFSKVWIWQDGIVTLLPTLTGDPDSFHEAMAINNQGQIVGRCRDGAGDLQPVIWNSVAIETLDMIPDSQTSYASDLNDDGLVVGGARFGTDERRAILWDLDRKSHNLNDLLDDSGDGWVLNRAYAINNNGWIVGGGVNPDGKDRGFLLIPIPEPSTLVLLAMGAIGLLIYALRRRR